MTWFSVKDGLATFAALRTHLASGEAQGIPSAKVAKLVEEIDSCTGKLEEVTASGAKFHLAVVM